MTAEQVAAISRFPDDNPNPVMRMDADGRLIYANPASGAIIAALGIGVDDLIPPDVVNRLEAAAKNREYVELVADSRTYAVWPVFIPDMNFTNLYGTDVTAERAIVKFPDQNPNPVLRIDPRGVLVYANAASSTLTQGLGLEVGAGLPADLRDELLARAGSSGRTAVEVETEGHVYTLLPVDVPEFGFVNVYGTDITAVKERERLAAENERLLLNILPEPIAQRLRNGEHLIADRFDDVTLLFADIVEFTQLSASMSPAELVSVLNEIFTVFDRLVDRYRLEKVKTIGDAYMVIGGMTDGVGDHTRRVAEFALDLVTELDRQRAAGALGVGFRIGMHCGPIVAGVIGTKKFIYDVWGDTVNLASRMESLGLQGRIQLTHAVKERLEGGFELEPRGLIRVKGKGPMPTWFLTGRLGAAAGTAAAEVSRR